MKKVFEQLLVASKNFLNLCESDDADAAEYPKVKSALKNAISAAEDLPESKQEKNCGNCGLIQTTAEYCQHSNQCVGHHHKHWQPKPAEPKHIIPSDCAKHTDIKPQENGGSIPEPESWEQRFCIEECLDDECFERKNKTCRTKDFIRAEIERAREEEKQAIMTMLDEYELELLHKRESADFRGGITRAYLCIEQNKHRRSHDKKYR